MTVRAIKVKGEKLSILAHADSSEQLITGATTGGTPTGWNFKVKDTYVYWVDTAGAERRKEGTLTGGSRAYRNIKIKGETLLYGDINGDERYVQAALVVSSDDKTNFDGQGTLSGGGGVGDTVYVPVHDAANAIGVTNYNQDHAIGQRYNLGSMGRYQIFRAVMRFDLSELPIGESIVSAVMTILRSSSTPTQYRDWNLVLVDGSDCGDPLVVADYGDLLDDTTSLGTIAISSTSVNTAFEITLNAAGKTFLEGKAGSVAVIAIRSSEDISLTVPPDYNAGEYTEITISLITSTEGEYPYITITI